MPSASTQLLTPAVELTPARSGWRVRALVFIVALGLLGTGAVVLAGQPGEAATSSTVTGVDVSGWDHPNGALINWPQVKASGRAFAIVKATEGTTFVNSWFATDYPQARAAGLVVGAYHFARPKLPISTAAAEARHYVRTVGTFRGANLLPPVLDVEVTGGLSPSELRAWIQTWLDTAQSMTGRVPIIYTYDSFVRTSLANTTAFRNYPLWYARYTTTTPTSSTLPGGWSRWTMWQFTSTGSTPGIPDTGDINRFNGSLAELRAFADGRSALGTPTVPSGLRVSASGAGWAKVLWDTPSDNGGAPINGYQVSIDGGPWVTAPKRVYIATGLSGGDHTVAVRALNVAGEGPSASFPVTVSATGASAPATTASMSLSMPASVTTGSFLVTSRVSRADTGQALLASPLKVTQIHEKGPSPAPFTVSSAADGSLSRTLSATVDTRVTVRFPGAPGIPAKAVARSARVTPWLTASFNDASVPKGTKVRLTARTTYLLKGEKVQRQYFSGGRWRTIASATIGADGKASFIVPVNYTGTRSYRVLLPSTSAHSWKYTPTMALRGW